MQKIAICLLMLASNLSFGQRLPKIQQGSFRAPDKIRIDGKIEEWGRLKAYNKATQVYYSISNNDTYLFLVVKVVSPGIIDKIVRGGLTLSINSKAKKKVKEIPAITFPIYTGLGPRIFLNLKNRPAASGDLIKDKMLVDSLATKKNELLGENLKWISAVNLDGVSDSLLSVYNADGIKVAYRLDGDLCYNFELSVPLKDIGLSGSSSSFFYNVQLNGESYYFQSVQELRPGYFEVTKADGKSYRLQAGSDADIIYSTDFWGEYKLIN